MIDGIESGSGGELEPCFVDQRGGGDITRSAAMDDSPGQSAQLFVGDTEADIKIACVRIHPDSSCY